MGNWFESNIIVLFSIEECQNTIRFKGRNCVLLHSIFIQILLIMPLIDYRFLGKIIPKGKIQKSFTSAKSSYLNRVRWATALFFFGMGLCFATWASRIPDIKLALQLSEAELGTLLFALPIGQLVAMPLSGKIVTLYGSRKIAIAGLFVYAFCLILLGLATTKWQLALYLFLFGFSSNFCNIAVNTQGVFTQQLFEKPIMGSFHGSWSLAGFSGALLGLIMLTFHLSPFQHFVIVLFLITLLIFFNYSFLVIEKSKKKEEEKRGVFFF